MRTASIERLLPPDRRISSELRCRDISAGPAHSIECAAQAIRITIARNDARYA